MPKSLNGLILFGHGARDPRWAEPLRRLLARISAKAPETPIELAFLEIMEPDLGTAAAHLVANGCNGLTIVPIFLGQGPHVRKDLAALVERLRVEYPTLDIRCVAPVGDDDGVLDALAGYALAALPTARRRPRTA